jgi:hypothetical protein
MNIIHYVYWFTLHLSLSLQWNFSYKCKLLFM